MKQFCIGGALSSGGSRSADLPSETSNELNQTAPVASRKRTRQQQQKQEKKQETCFAPSQRYAYVSCFDEPERLIEIDLDVFRPFGPRLYHIICKDPPDGEQNGKKFWRTGMTRAMVITLQNSLTANQLVIAKGVTVAEAMAIMDRENLNVGGRLRPPPAGAAFPKRSETTHETLQTTCEQIAQCLAQWPRLECCLDAALRGPQPKNSVSATRAWITFAKKPMARPLSSAFGADYMHSLARKMPRWLLSTLVSIGIVHYNMCRDGSVDFKARDRDSYTALYSAVESNGLGNFMPSVYDCSKSNPTTNANLRKDVLRGEKFATEIKNAVLEGSMCKDRPLLQYATAVFSLAEFMLDNSPSPASLFRSTCTDDHGKSLERTLLKKALQQRGISIVRWAEEDNPSRKPLMWPPGWLVLDGPTVLSKDTNHSSVLLEFVR